MKESLKHASFYLDINYYQKDDKTSSPTTGGSAIATVATGGGAYVPASGPQREAAVLWTKRKYVGDECTLLREVPPGYPPPLIFPYPSHRYLPFLSPVPVISFRSIVCTL